MFAKSKWRWHFTVQRFCSWIVSKLPRTEFSFATCDRRQAWFGTRKLFKSLPSSLRLRFFAISLEHLFLLEVFQKYVLKISLFCKKKRIMKPEKIVWKITTFWRRSSNGETFLQIPEDWWSRRKEDEILLVKVSSSTCIECLQSRHSNKHFFVPLPVFRRKSCNKEASIISFRKAIRPELMGRGCQIR